MYQNIYLDSYRRTIHLWDDKKGYVTFPYKQYAYVKDSNGTHFSLYGDRLKKIYNYDKDMPNLFESDVHPEVRTLVDMYTDSEDLSEGHRVLIFDIEVEVTDGFPTPQKAENTITSIALYDSMTEHYLCLTLDPKKKLVDSQEDDVTIISYDSEYDLLNAFFTRWMEIQPTIVTGWNIDFFDIPYLYNRSVQVLGPDVANSLSPIGQVNYNKFRNKYSIAGVSCLDYLSLYKLFTYTELSSYRLDAVGEHEVGQKKVEYSGTLNELFENDIQKFVEYNIQDVRLIKKIDDKCDFINMARGVCHVGHVPYEDIYMSSRYLEGAILVYLKQNNIVAPNKPPRPKKLDDDKFIGAFVQDPQKGRHEWVFDLDITSMYPSIIMSLNISPEMKIGKINGWSAKEYIKGTKKTYSVTMGGKDVGEMNERELSEFFDKTNCTIASNGVMYKNEKKGLIPTLLARWFDTRKEYRQLAKKYADEDNQEKYDFFNRRQHIQKIVLNSLYGVLGLPVFRFYDLDNAEATTVTGQELIKYSKTIANHFYNKELGTNEDYCIYIDTDSVFYSAVPLIQKRYNKKLSEVMMVQRISEIASELQNFLNNSYDYFATKFCQLKTPHRFEIKQELIAKSGLFITKKRYGMKIINDNGVKVNKLHVKGLDIVRSSFPKTMGILLSEVLNDILMDVPKEKVDSRILRFKKNIRRKRLDMVACPIGVKNLAKYKVNDKDTNSVVSTFEKGAPIHVKAACHYNDLLAYYGKDKIYQGISSGDKIMWVYLKDNPLNLRVCAFKGHEDPDEIIRFISENINYDKMFKQLLKKKLELFYDCLSWDEPTDKAKTIERFF